jgi:hypothetical protein
MDCRSLLIAAALLALPVFASGAEEPQRPHCDAKHLGQFWPDAKDDATAVQKLAQRGELQVCSRTGDWHYGWQKLTITVDQMKLERKKTGSSSANSK